MWPRQAMVCTRAFLARPCLRRPACTPHLCVHAAPLSRHPSYAPGTGDGEIMTAKEESAAYSDDNPDYPGSCGRCYEVGASCPPPQFAPRPAHCTLLPPLPTLLRLKHMGFSGMRGARDELVALACAFPSAVWQSRKLGQCETVGGRAQDTINQMAQQPSSRPRSNAWTDLWWGPGTCPSRSRSCTTSPSSQTCRCVNCLKSSVGEGALDGSTLLRCCTFCPSASIVASLPSVTSGRFVQLLCTPWNPAEKPGSLVA